ncbi:MAG: ABC transporter permease, partial [Acidimicrobiia bacterium]
IIEGQSPVALLEGKKSRGDRPGVVTSLGGRIGKRLINLAAALGIFYLFIPIFLIVTFSFNNPKGRANVKWEGFTLKHWQGAFSVAKNVDPLLLSLKIALIATIVATVLGSFMAIALVRYRFVGGGLVNFLLVLPLTTPEIVLGASLVTLFFGPPLIGGSVRLGETTILLAHIMFCLSFVVMTVKARLRGFNWTLEDAAMDLGAPPARAFRKVTLPLILPGVIAAGMLSFALSIDDYIVTRFVSGNDTMTFPLRIANASRTSTPPEIYVLSAAILFVSVGLLIVGALLRRLRFGPASK